MIEGICERHNLPALGVAIVRLGREPEVYVTGVRTAGGRDRVQIGDTWHLGSDTKAFTAALVAYYIDKHKGAYSDRIAGLLNVSKPDPAYAQKTVADLLDMMGNLAHDPDKGWFYYQGLGGNGSQRRQAAAEDVLTTAPHGIKLGQFNYSNTGYTLLGHIAEDWAYMPYEDALTAKILKPLRITSGGFGRTRPASPNHMSTGSR
jgi:D-alanyl-D-alanine carboxypeptidase